VLDDPSQALLFVVVQDTAFFVLTIGFFWVGVSVARRLGRPVGYSLAPLGFSKPKRGYLAGVGLGLTVGTVALVASLLITPLSAYVVEELGYSSESRVQGPLREGLESWVGESPETAIPAIVAVVVFLGPAAEELVFRGAVFGGLYRLGLFFSRKLGGKPDGRGRGTGEQVSFALSALISSVLFSLVHLEPVILLVLFILAVVLCALYRRTKSLLPCLVAHATFNSFAVLVIVLMGLGALPVPPI
jgi:membrane protease YdiL (CAAX protease family)